MPQHFDNIRIDNAAIIQSQDLLLVKYFPRYDVQLRSISAHPKADTFTSCCLLDVGFDASQNTCGSSVKEMRVAYFIIISPKGQCNGNYGT